jgi:hypothetical protein
VLGLKSAIKNKMSSNEFVQKLYTKEKLPHYILTIAGCQLAQVFRFSGSLVSVCISGL